MPSENELISKLLVSKKIMDKHSAMPRGGREGIDINPNLNENISVPKANYNLPEEFIRENSPKVQNVQNKPMTTDRIMSSKLPDEIKKLMIEHPISQPAMSTGPTLSDDLVEKAARLMHTDASGKVLKESSPRTQPQPIQDTSNLKQLIRETMKEILAENGLLVESTNKGNEVFSFRVGKHIFEGKVTKIKKVA